MRHGHSALEDAKRLDCARFTAAFARRRKPPNVRFRFPGCHPAHKAALKRAQSKCWRDIASSAPSSGQASGFCSRQIETCRLATCCPVQPATRNLQLVGYPSFGSGPAIAVFSRFTMY